MLFIIIGLLFLTNLGTLLWAFKTRVPMKISKQVRAIQATIAAFEVEGQTILRIERIPPDLVFLRNPSQR